MNQEPSAAQEAPAKEWVRPVPYGFDPRSKNVALACFLSLMPGLGQVYVGYYQRGFMHILVVGSIIATLAEGALRELTPLLAIFLAFFWLYNVIDAGRRASLYNQALAGAGPTTLPEDLAAQGLRGSVVGGVVLIALGTALLLHTRFDISLRWLDEWWPAAPILFGVYLVIKGMRGKSQAA